MNTELINSYLERGKESKSCEFKNYQCLWSVLDNKCKYVIFKTILALANTKGGGIIFIGVDDTGKRIGLKSDVVTSYKHDVISRNVRELSAPCPKFTVTPHSYEGKDFVIIDVQESENIVLSLDDCFIDKSQKHLISNLAVRKNAIYIRRGNPVESAEANDPSELNERIERVVELKEEHYLRVRIRGEKLKVGNKNMFDERLSTDKYS